MHANGQIFTANSKSVRPRGTRVTAASNGVALPTGVIDVVSTTGFPASGFIALFTSVGLQYVAYTGVTATSFTGCTGGTGIMSVDRLVAPATLINGAQALPAAVIAVDSTTGFPAPAGVATTVLVAGALPQSEIEITDSTGLATNGFVLITTTTGVKQLISYTGISASDVDDRATLKNCQGGLGTIASGAAVEAAAQLFVTNNAGFEQLIVYTNTTPTTFTGCTGGTGTLADNEIIQPTGDADDFVAGTWAIDFGIPVGQISTPAEIAAIKWDAALVFNPIIPTGFPPPPFCHCHALTPTVSGFSFTPNTAIPPIQDNSVILVTGTLVCNCGVIGLSSPLPYTLNISRSSGCCCFSLQINNYIHQLSRMLGVGVSMQA